MKNAKNGRVILLGFDGMDYDLTDSLMESGDLANFKKLANQGGAAPFLSVFPPDSIPSWITIYTGADPSEHGILDHVNYLLGDSGADIDTSVFHGKTFWDRIGNECNAKVCVINPFMAYPVWPVNGVMISGPVFVEGNIQISDPGYVANTSIPQSIGGITVFPKKSNLKPYYDDTVRDTLEQAEFGISMLKEHNPGFFFQTFLTTDRVQHHYWRYCDANDPTYPGKNNVDTSIKDFFRHIDSIVGQFMAEMRADDLLILISDHGHGMRCTECFNINEFLFRKGYLKSNSTKQRFDHKVLIEKCKNRVLKFLHDNDLEDYISKIAKFVPNAKNMKKGAHLTNYADSMAYAPDFAGTNPFGGICINKDRVDNYNAFRAELIQQLSQVSYKSDPIFKWLRPREEIYNGKHIERYPDILYEMVPELGTGYALHTDLFTVNPTHKKISGGHKANGIFFVNQGDSWAIDPATCKVTNMYSTLLSLFGIESDSNPSGKSILRSRDWGGSQSF